MKALTLILIGSLLFSFNSKKIEKLEIRKSDFEILTIMDVDCDKFEYYFGDNLKCVAISDQKTISLFESCLKELKPDPKNKTPDTRAKVFIHYSDASIDTLCLDNFKMHLNGQSFLIDDNIKTIIIQSK